MYFNGAISDSRLEEIKKCVKEKGMSISYRDFAVYEIKIIIDQTVLTDEERKIAELKYIRNKNNREIYFEMDWDSESACYSHIKHVSHQLKRCCNMIFI